MSAKYSKPKTIAEEQYCNSRYCCGKGGHFSSKCTNPGNSSQIIQRLIQSLQKSKSRDLLSREASPGEANSGVKRSAVAVQRMKLLSEGLVGPTPVISTKVFGNLCDALLDSGSQVTIIFEDWY